MIINPWGEVLAQLGGVGLDALGKPAPEPEVAIADIDVEAVEKARREMPLLRRTDVYPQI